MNLDVKLDIHQYDGKIDKKVYKFIQDVINQDSLHLRDKNELAQQCIKEVYESACNPKINKSRYDPNLMHNIAKAYTVNEYDRLNHIDTQTAFIIAWNLCKERGEIDLAFLSLYDMHVTNGYCIQGRTVRCLQIIAVLME